MHANTHRRSAPAVARRRPCQHPRAAPARDLRCLRCHHRPHLEHHCAAPPRARPAGLEPRPGANRQTARQSITQTGDTTERTQDRGSNSSERRRHGAPTRTYNMHTKIRTYTHTQSTTHNTRDSELHARTGTNLPQREDRRIVDTSGERVELEQTCKDGRQSGLTKKKQSSQTVSDSALRTTGGPTLRTGKCGDQRRMFLSERFPPQLFGVHRILVHAGAKHKPSHRANKGNHGACLDIRAVLCLGLLQGQEVGQLTA